MVTEKYFLTVGLEIHAELKTQTKMFCGSRNDPDETRPNVNICPVCMGHPGTLPVINREAVKYVLKVGLALGGTLADFTEFDRKNYFYPDIPKGYQISQYKYPLVSGGALSGVAITRVHLEEDTARSEHSTNNTQQPTTNYSLVDFNRAGVPLMELVTEPVIHSAKEAGDFARELQLLLRYLGASDANMEKGEMRVEANISTAPREGVFGTKVEVKNLNSFRSVERAIAYELSRQEALLEAGERVVQETRGWDEAKQQTFSQRRKEESHDYRYFPDPDLPKLYLSSVPEFSREALQSEMSELPAAKRERLIQNFGLKREDAEIFLSNRALGHLFEETSAFLKEPKLIQLAANYLTSDLVGLIGKAGKEADTLSFAFTPEAAAELVRMVASGDLSSRGAKDILAVLFDCGGSPQALAEEMHLLQKSDARELQKIVGEIISANPKVAADYRAGKEAALQFLVGQGMKATRGAGNPEILRELLKDALTTVP